MVTVNRPPSPNCMILLRPRVQARSSFRPRSRLTMYTYHVVAVVGITIYDIRTRQRSTRDMCFTIRILKSMIPLAGYRWLAPFGPFVVSRSSDRRSTTLKHKSPVWLVGYPFPLPDRYAWRRARSGPVPNTGMTDEGLWTSLSTWAIASHREIRPFQDGCPPPALYNTSYISRSISRFPTTLDPLRCCYNMSFRRWILIRGLSDQSIN